MLAHRFATGFKEGYYNLLDYIQGNIHNYLVNKFMKKVGLPLRLISAVNTVMNLSGWSILQYILTKFGLAYLLNYLWWIVLL